MPAVVRDFLDAAGTTDAVPWDGRPMVSPSDPSFCRPRPLPQSWDTGAGPNEGLGTFDPAALSEAEWQELLGGGDSAGGLPGGADRGGGGPDEGDPGARDPGSPQERGAASSSGGWSGGADEGERPEGSGRGRRRILAEPPLLRDDGLDQGGDDEALPWVRRAQGELQYCGGAEAVASSWLCCSASLSEHNAWFRVTRALPSLSGLQCRARVGMELRKCTACEVLSW